VIAQIISAGGVHELLLRALVTLGRGEDELGGAISSHCQAGRPGTDPDGLSGFVAAAPSGPQRLERDDGTVRRWSTAQVISSHEPNLHAWARRALDRARARVFSVGGAESRRRGDRVPARSPDMRRVWTWRPTSTAAAHAALSFCSGPSGPLPRSRRVPRARPPRGASSLHPCSPARSLGWHGCSGGKSRAERRRTSCRAGLGVLASPTSRTPLSSTCPSHELEQDGVGPGRGAGRGALPPLAPVLARVPPGGMPHPTALEVLTWETSVCCT
jgi:hypothetical protein